MNGNQYAALSRMVYLAREIHKNYTNGKALRYVGELNRIKAIIPYYTLEIQWLINRLSSRMDRRAVFFRHIGIMIQHNFLEIIKRKTARSFSGKADDTNRYRRPQDNTGGIVEGQGNEVEKH